MNLLNNVLPVLIELRSLVFTLDVKGKVVAGLIVAIIAAVCGRLIDGLFTLCRYVLGRQLRRRIEDDHFTPADIQDRVVRNRESYIRPHCQDRVPEDPNSSVKRKKIFKEIDNLLGSHPPERSILILADTGMGKTELLDRYYARCWRSSRRCKRFKPVIIPLNRGCADDLIARISPEAQSRTLLLLDALDEDKAAIEAFPSRLAELVRLADKFYAVIITCRTQFYPSATSIPKRTHPPLPSVSLPHSEGMEQTVKQLYLSPFNSWQVSRFIAARFRPWRHPIFRIRAEIATRRFRDLLCRPLLLTYIQDIAPSPKEMRYSFQAYRVIVDKWLNREKKEKHIATPPENLLRFSEDFAVSLFRNNQDRVPSEQLEDMAARCSFDLVPREVRVRSLLHNDSAGNWKFAHGSIMEFLLVCVASRGENRTPWSDRRWTSQMREFARDMLHSGEYKRMPGADLENENLTGADLRNADLSGANLTGANLVNAKTDFANFCGACFDGTALHGLNLSQVLGLTLPQAAAANSDDRTIWPVRIINGYARDVYSLAISGDGRRVVSVSSGGSVKVWDIFGGRQARPLPPLHLSYVNEVALSGDGALAVSASSDHTLKVWDLEEGCELPPPLIGHSGAVYCVALSSDGKLGASVSFDKTLRVWNVCDRRERISPLECQLGVAAIALSSDGKLAMIVSNNECLDVWSLEEQRKTLSTTIGFGVVHHLALNADARLVVSASYDGTLRVWDTESGQGRMLLNGHTDEVTGIALSQGGHLAVYDSGNRTMRVWFPPDGPEIPHPEVAHRNTMRTAT